MIGFTRSMRKFWVSSLRKRSQDMLAINALRNWCYVVNANGSTAIALMLAVAAIFRFSSKPDDPASFLFGDDDDDANLMWIKMLLIVLCLLLCFFFLSQAMRFFDHLSFLMCVTKADLDSLGADGNVFPNYETILSQFLDTVQRANFFYSMGVRCYYLIFPLVVWLFGPYYFIVASVINIGIFLFLDSNPGYFDGKDISNDSGNSMELQTFSACS